MPAERDVHLAVLTTTSAIAVFLALQQHPAFAAAALALHAAGFATRIRPWRAPAVALPIAVTLALAAVWALVLLTQRPAYHYVPFVTLASLAACATVAAWWVFAHEVRRAQAEGMTLIEGDGARILAAVPFGAAFVWGRAELAAAGSPDLATFLLIGYYAVVGVGAIVVGRRRQLARARQVGLLLACYAALKALVEAWGLTAIGLRVGSCLLAGLFITLVAYLYRDRSERAAAAPSPTPVAPPPTA
jgi:hypothetical protein